MADNSAGNWCLIESDPGVFTELIKEFGEWPTKILSSIEVNIRLKFSLFAMRFFPGCDGVQVEELWSLDSEQFKSLE